MCGGSGCGGGGWWRWRVACLPSVSVRQPTLAEERTTTLEKDNAAATAAAADISQCSLYEVSTVMVAMVVRRHVEGLVTKSTSYVTVYDMPVSWEEKASSRHTAFTQQTDMSSRLCVAGVRGLRGERHIRSIFSSD